MDNSIRKLPTPVKDAPDYRAILGSKWPEIIPEPRQDVELNLNQKFQEAKPKCRIRGVIGKGMVCSAIIVGGVLCGTPKPCQFKEVK